ncbi:SPOR domain-containing protein [Salinispirillum sp. LH 10-3-1]|uniref:SPOR domain-containing protein n=1 Tax=Salinispirillum sp. LH 10-3-1 TaxID=2952525 RepID=A0AB38YEN6_9GAMM
MTLRGSLLFAKSTLLLVVLLTVTLSALGQAFDDEPELLILEVRLDQTVLSGGLPAYDDGTNILLPLGELSQLLTIAITADPVSGIASGFVLSSRRTFELDANRLLVNQAGTRSSINPEDIYIDLDDIYVTKSLVESWLPVNLDFQRSRLSLLVEPREILPLQAQLLRERRAARNGQNGNGERAHFEFEAVPYRIISSPAIDQAVGWRYQNSLAGDSTSMDYSALITSDLMGLEATAAISVREPDWTTDLRFTLGRKSPEPELLGPLRARSFIGGDISATSVPNVTPGVFGRGININNRPLSRPSEFSQHTFTGEVPPGWDVELYYNDVLVDYQPPNGERYLFENQPLSYGRNEFTLVFNGPFGERRVENRVFNLSQSMLAPGETQYDLSWIEDQNGRTRASFQLDAGISEQLTLTSSFSEVPVNGGAGQYTGFGARTYWQALSLRADWVDQSEGGYLVGYGGQTRFAGINLDAYRSQLYDFESATFSRRADPLVARTEARASSALPLLPRVRLPWTTTFKRDELESGEYIDEASLRVSTFVQRVSLSNTLTWRRSAESETVTGRLQASRRWANTSVRSQLAYNLDPEQEATNVSANITQTLGNGYRATANVNHSLQTDVTRYGAGFNKSLGMFGLGLSGSYVDSNDYSISARLFASARQTPQHGDWQVDARPTARSGMISATVFIDENGNGVWDEGEPLLENVGFLINGVRNRSLTDEQGVVTLSQLPTHRYLDIELNVGTLEDLQWQPVVKGRRVMLRPGMGQNLLFPVQVTSEIDGTVFVLSEETERGASNIQVELLDQTGQVVARDRTAWDGFYILMGVPAGDYELRINPEQLEGLGWRYAGPRQLEVPEGGDFISGIDISLFSADYEPSVSAPIDVPETMAPVDSDAAQPMPERPMTVDGAPETYLTGVWLQSQPDSYFTIQLMAARTEQTVLNFIAANGLQGNANYFASLYQGAPWYSLIYGHYRTYEEAQQALSELPPALREAEPWVRSYALIKQLAR